MKYKTLGWQHILIRVPDDWHMIFGKKRGKKSKKGIGYFGFRDSKTKKLELSWAKISKKPPKIKTVIDDYLKSLKKSSKKINIKSERLNKINEHEAKSVYWELEKEIQGYLIVWICNKTERLILCTSQFPTAKKSTEKPLIMEIMSHINCHPESLFSIWSAPNLQIHAPFLTMNLINNNFLIGLTFVHLRDETLDLLAYRIGLADQKIQSPNEMTNWYNEYYKENLPGIPSHYYPAEFKKFFYKKKVIIWRSIQRPKKKTLFGLSKTYYDTYLWSNPEKNDIYCIIFSMKHKPSTKTRNLCEKMIKLTIGSN